MGGCQDLVVIRGGYGGVDNPDTWGGAWGGGGGL